jgi:hypothetical protein
LDAREITLVSAKHDDDVYSGFLSVLRLLSKDPEQQCKSMGDFRVARGIKIDGCGLMEPVLGLAGRDLSEEQRSKIREIIDGMEAIPDEVATAEDRGKEANIRAMNHPCWSPIRVHARQLLNLLEDETGRDISLPPNT